MNYFQYKEKNYEEYYSIILYKILSINLELFNKEVQSIMLQLKYKTSAFGFHQHQVEHTIC